MLRELPDFLALDIEESHGVEQGEMQSAVSGEESPQCKKDMDLVDQDHYRATKILTGLEHPSYEEKLRELGLFSQETIMRRRDIIMVYTYLMAQNDVEGLWFF
ncbi:hypothetical protein QYF61_011636 [Mycteria americana]|uniref:Uncharacterized protein n=1 Tax=Mycteria americana TaxID=33587 RepID=A0AAN7NFR8_MYCAM|nr:hypothetical protein QYF61_011636 [Mycteria americana]